MNNRNVAKELFPDDSTSRARSTQANLPRSRAHPFRRRLRRAGQRDFLSRMECLMDRKTNDIKHSAAGLSCCNSHMHDK